MTFSIHILSVRISCPLKVSQSITTLYFSADPKAKVCSRLVPGMAGSNPPEGMGVLLVFVVCCVGSGFCDELITRSEGYYRACVCACVVRACVIWKPQNTFQSTQLSYYVTLQR